MLNLVNPSAFAVHPAIERCLQAGRAAHAEALAQEKSSDQSSSDQPPSDQPEARFRDAYMQAMPDLSSRENVCAFIAGCPMSPGFGDMGDSTARCSVLRLG